MRRYALFLAAVLCSSWFLTGCGQPPPKKVIVTNVTPTVRQGINHGELLAGLTQFVPQLNKTTVPAEGGGYQWMGYTNDRTSAAGDQSAGFVVSGEPADVNFILFSATLPPDECAKADKAPDWVQRNQRIQRQFLANLFKDKVPADVPKALETLKDKPDQAVTVDTDKGPLILKYTPSDKKVSISIKLKK
jgi:hypothetical protein